MLYLIKGRAGSGKTRLLRQKIQETLNDKSSRPLLLVPEQFSFDTERAMLSLLGPAELKNIDVFSFTRLAMDALKNTPYFTKNIPDAGTRNLLMSEALFQLDGRLNVFSDVKPTVTALAPLVDFCKELKYCCIDSEEIEDITVNGLDGTGISCTSRENTLLFYVDPVKTRGLEKTYKATAVVTLPNTGTKNGKLITYQIPISVTLKK